MLDARACISYATIEKRGSLPTELQGRMTNHVFGCDICQDVCPWNRRAPVVDDPAFQPRAFAPKLEELNAMTEEDFTLQFSRSPVKRAKYKGFQRNVANALRNIGR
jgi:epoxyqueuosine reductase